MLASVLRIGVGGCDRLWAQAFFVVVVVVVLVSFFVFFCFVFFWGGRYGVVPKGLVTFLGLLGNAEFSPWKRLPEFIELRKS